VRATKHRGSNVPMRERVLSARSSACVLGFGLGFSFALAFVALAGAGFAAVGALGCSSKSPPAAAVSDAGAEDMSPTRPAATPVAPLFIGTGGFGFAVGSSFVGAAAPQGFAKVGPDTSGPWGVVDFLHCSGYWYGDDTVLGFSHLHLQGTGVPDGGVIALMPTDVFDASRTTAAAYAAKMDKSSETNEPGKYAVTLVSSGVRVEIAATAHAAHHRYTFASKSAAAHVVLDLAHHLERGHVESELLDVDAAARTVRGSVKSVGGLSGGFGGTTFFFALRTKDAWSSAEVWSQGQAPMPGTHASGAGVGLVLDFDLATLKAPVEIQVALSLVSTDAALANLDAEMPSFDFDGVAKKTAAEWSDATSVVRFDGGSREQRAMLDAALYHALLMPTVVSDVDGAYVGIDGKLAHAEGYRYSTDMSLWDTYRTLHPLYDLAMPDRARDVVRSLTAMAKASGSFPKWPTGTGEAGTMIGSSAEVVLADAYVKGIRDFDAEGAYAIMRGAAMDRADPPRGRGGRNNVIPYMDLGFVPASFGASASVTIEYGQDDAALAQFARALGHEGDAATLEARAHGWQKLYDPASGFLWAKSADGSWATSHGDPTIATDDFDEANAWQSVWGPWFDFDGLVSVLGGRDALVAKLESFFEQGKEDYDAIHWTQALSAGTRRKFFWGGNEPDIHAVYLFALAGRADLTQKWVRWIENEVYSAGADGLPGNDDGGTMSAWLVFSALGIYPVPGTDHYVVGAPMFPHAEVKVLGGVLTVDAPNVSDANVYVRSVTLDGSPLTSSTLRHADLHAGAKLVFDMTNAPAK
jgi:predicted alpha-1,2-mannosidase